VRQVSQIPGANRFLKGAVPSGAVVSELRRPPAIAGHRGVVQASGHGGPPSPYPVKIAPYDCYPSQTRYAPGSAAAAPSDIGIESRCSEERGNIRGRPLPDGYRHFAHCRIGGLLADAKRVRRATVVKDPP